MGFLDTLSNIVTGTPLLGSIVSAGASLIGGNQQAKAQEAANKQNYKMFKEQLGFTEDMWNKTNEYNTPANQRKRFEDAGFNPYLMMNSTNNGNAVSQVGSSGNPMQPVDARGRALQQVGQNIGQALAQARPQLQQVMSNREAVKSQIIENAFRASHHQQQLSKEIVEVDKMLSDKAVSDETRKNLVAQREQYYEQLKQLQAYTKYASRRALADTEKAENEADLAFASANREREMGVYYNTLNAYLPQLQSAQIRSLGAQVLQTLAQSDLIKSQKTTEDALRDGRVKSLANQVLESSARTLGIKLDNKQKDAIMPYIIKRAKKEADAKKFGPFEYYGEFDYSPEFNDMMQGTSRW